MPQLWGLARGNHIKEGADIIAVGCSGTGQTHVSIASASKPVVKFDVALQTRLVTLTMRLDALGPPGDVTKHMPCEAVQAGAKVALPSSASRLRSVARHGVS